MGDFDLQSALRAWEQSRSPDALEAAIAAHRRAGIELPWALLSSSPRWSPVVDFVERWFERPLCEGDGLSWSDIRAKEEALGFRLPEVMREWHALLGGRSGIYDRGMIETVSFARLQASGEEIRLSSGHQGIGDWLVQVGDASPDPAVHFRLDEEEVVCDLSTYYQSLLEFQIGHVYVPPKGLRSSVKRAIRWDADDSLEKLKAVYLARPVLDSIMSVHADADTIIFYDSVELLGCAARNEEAWKRLEDLLGHEGWEPDNYS